MTKPKIKIDVVSDVVCPWCYIGKRRLEKAVDLLKNEIDFEIEYHPFELNPSTPKGGQNHKKYLIEKFGGEERYQQINNHVLKIAAQEGIHFQFQDELVIPNTFDLHRLIAFAKTKGKQKEIKEALMSAYFERNIDLTQPKNVIGIAEEQGLNRTEVEEFLNSNLLVSEIRNEEQLNYQRGISGVPFYIINNKYGVSGAQPTEAFVQIMNELKEESKPGEMCSVDENNC